MSFNILGAVQVAEAIGGLIPAGVSIVNSVEASLPAGSPVSAKLDLVKAGLNSIYSQFGTAEVAFESIWPHLSAMISAYQASGLAGLSAVAAAVAPAAQAAAPLPGAV